MLSPLLLLLACGPDPNAPPPRPEGVLEVLQVETGGGVVSGSDMVAGRNETCTWGREIWRFDGDALLVQNDVLCPSERADESFGCQVRVVGEATWDAERGVFVVPKRVGGMARFVGTKDSDIDPGLRTYCSVSLEAGEYPVARVRNGQWKWEMRTPAGVVLRLVVSDMKVDFGFAMAESETSNEAAP
jgi:hypothetical protein